jgi:hypothetical protein
MPEPTPDCVTPHPRRTHSHCVRSIEYICVGFPSCGASSGAKNTFLSFGGCFYQILLFPHHRVRLILTHRPRSRSLNASPNIVDAVLDFCDGRHVTAVQYFLFPFYWMDILLIVCSPDALLSLSAACSHDESHPVLFLHRKPDYLPK